jgi:hypothetical protein
MISKRRKTMHLKESSKIAIFAVLGLFLIFSSVTFAGRWVFTGAGWKWFEYCSVSPNADTYVDSFNPGASYGGEFDLYVGAPSGDPAQITRTYIKFDLSDIPIGSTIIAARLNMRSSSVGENPKIKVGAHYLANNAWDEGLFWLLSLTLIHEPIATDSLTVGSSDRWYSWNVTKDAATAFEMGAQLSEVLIGSAEGEKSQFCSFSSREEPEPAFQPYLEILYDPNGYVLTTGTEAYHTISASIEFGGPSGLPSIPVDFFGPGSDPFDGRIDLDGGFDMPEIPPESFFDVSMERTEGGFMPDSGPSGIVDTQMVALDLVSTAPIMVGGPAPNFPAEYDVTVELADPGTGQTIVTGSGDDTGGAFQYSLSPQWRLRFTPHNPMLDEKEILIPGALYTLKFEVLQEDYYGWTNTAFEENPPGGYDAFYPASGEGTLHNTLSYGGVPSGELDLLPPQEVHPGFMLNSFDEWTEANENGFIKPMSSDEWDQYMLGWGDPCYITEGNEYPVDVNFSPPELYVCEPNGPGPNNPGLVMVWGDPCTSTEDQNYASAWKYVYKKDPDLSRSVITVTVMPPSPSGINAISFSMTDQAGLMRSWWWSVPGVIPYDVGTTVTIDASRTGLNATNPPATGYASAPGFNNRAVQSLSADEDGTWFPSQAVPPPGKTIANLWNYWYNLSVTPKTQPVHVTSKFYVKWSQRPDVINTDDPKLIRGWDEPSNYYFKPIVADDWKCTDDRPVTDIHWWGSFLGWSQPYPPPVVPRAFHIGIWTDVPLGADPMYPDFSHPGYLIWENYCDSWVWNFFGYDIPPLGGEEDPNFYDKEACFQFNQLLSEDEWFYQEPNDIWDDDPNSSIYWLSISAIYDMNDFVQYPWGWKTRQPHWNDDAVVTFDVNVPPVDYPPGFPPPPNWPPTIGSAWKHGYPIEYPVDISWDMSFELTTNEPDPNQSSADLDYDGIVNFSDLAILAGQWLEAVP